MRGGTTSSTPGAASAELRSERAPQGEATPGEDAPPDAPDAAEDTRAPTGPRPSRSRMWAGRSLGLASVFIGTATLLATGHGNRRVELDTYWQLADLRVLAHDPLGSVWYLHTQPPAYNIVVGLLAWLGLPITGSVFAVYVASLAGIALLLHGLLVRLGVGPIVAGVIVAVTLLNPSLLATMSISSYETPVALLLIGSLYAMVRYLETPRTGWLLATAGLLTLTAMTRSLFNPPWVLAVLALVLVARRVTLRQAAAAFAIPVVLIGGWMLKNEIVFGVPTTSSWLGFNMQRGIVAPMDADLVRADVESGKVSDLALEYPWGLLDQYEKWLDGCRPVHANEAVSEPEKPPYRGIAIANFNNECYIPLYDQAQSDALTLVRRHPGRYLHDRIPALAMSYQPAHIGHPDTWLDKAYGTVLLPVHVTIGMSDWNLPLVKGIETTGLPITVSLTLIGLSLFVAGRGVLALVRMVRIGWRDRASWPAGELVWLVVAFTTAVIVLGGDLIEFGENGRFRATLDPLLLALPLAALALVVQRRRERPDPDTEPDPSLPPA
jgi:hypothetical protein